MGRASDKNVVMYYNMLVSTNDPVDLTFSVFHPKLDNVIVPYHFGTLTDAIDVKNEKVIFKY